MAEEIDNGRIEVSISTLEQDTMTMEDLIKKLTRDMELVCEDIAQVNAMWEGPANRVFNNEFTRDMVNYHLMLSTIGELKDSMMNAVTSYRKCEADISQEIDRIVI